MIKVVQFFNFQSLKFKVWTLKPYWGPKAPSRAQRALSPPQELEGRRDRETDEQTTKAPRTLGWSVMSLRAGPQNRPPANCLKIFLLHTWRNVNCAMQLSVNLHLSDSQIVQDSLSLHDAIDPPKLDFEEVIQDILWCYVPMYESYTRHNTSCSTVL